jgi:hypothetical protein
MTFSSAREPHRHISDQRARGDHNSKNAKLRSLHSVAWGSETSGLDFVFPRQHVRLFSRNVLDKLTQQRQGILQRFHIVGPLFFDENKGAMNTSFSESLLSGVNCIMQLL